jgi:hypothetical protein
VPEPATARKEAASKISTASVGRRGALIVSSYHVVVGVLCVVFDSNVCRAHIPSDGVGSGGSDIRLGRAALWRCEPDREACCSVVEWDLK